MQCLIFLERFFNNQSVGAFLGAFAAFALVVLNDRRRDLRKVRNLSAEIEMNLAHAKGKLETIRNNRSLMREQNRLMAAPILKFTSALVRQLAAGVLERLTLDQRRAIEALCYTMEAVDSLLDDTYASAKKLSGTLGQADRMLTAERLLTDYGDAIVNLKRLIEMCDCYINRQYAVIVTKQYDRLEYEEA